MKKVILTIIICAASVAVQAQTPDIDSATIIVKEKGVYEQKRVVQVDDVKSSTLYRRAMEALSDWTGPDGRSKAGLDYCDKDEGIVTYKGEFYNGYRKLLMGELPFYTDFTLKVRCKDGRAQVTVTVPTMHATLPNGQTKTWNIREIIEAREKTNPKKLAKNDKKIHALSTREVVEIILKSMESALKGQSEDDF